MQLHQDSFRRGIWLIGSLLLVTALLFAAAFVFGSGRVQAEPEDAVQQEADQVGDGAEGVEPDGDGSAEEEPAGDGSEGAEPDGDGSAEEEPAGDGSEGVEPDGDGSVEEEPDGGDSEGGIPEEEGALPFLCEGLQPLTMYVNSVTLQRMEELTKSTSSRDAGCTIQLTLYDISSQEFPADVSKSCAVTATLIRNEDGIDISTTEAGDCETVGLSASLDFESGPENEPRWLAQTATDEARVPVGSDEPGAEGAARAGDCNYDTRGDNPHRSRSNNSQISAHGWWVAKTRPACPLYADVSVTLQQWRCRYGLFSIRCDWVTVTKAKKRLKTDRHSSRRTTARRHCANHLRMVSYRNVVDVNLVGVRDPKDKAYMVDDVACLFINERY